MKTVLAICVLVSSFFLFRALTLAQAPPAPPPPLPATNNVIPCVSKVGTPILTSPAAIECTGFQNLQNVPIRPEDVTILIQQPLGTNVATADVSSVTALNISSRVFTFSFPTTLVANKYYVLLRGRITVSGKPIDFSSAPPIQITVQESAYLKSANPMTAKAGQPEKVVIFASQPIFRAGAVEAAFGPGVSVSGAAEGGFGPLNVISATQAEAYLQVSSLADEGYRIIQVRSGPWSLLTLPGFSVVRQPGSSPTITAATKLNIEKLPNLEPAADKTFRPDEDSWVALLSNNTTHFNQTTKVYCRNMIILGQFVKSVSIVAIHEKMPTKLPSLQELFDCVAVTDIPGDTEVAKSAIK
jgi:hypothetical protein